MSKFYEHNEVRVSGPKTHIPIQLSGTYWGPISGTISINTGPMFDVPRRPYQTLLHRACITLPQIERLQSLAWIPRSIYREWKIIDSIINGHHFWDLLLKYLFRLGKASNHRTLKKRRSLLNIIHFTYLCYSRIK